MLCGWPIGQCELHGCGNHARFQAIASSGIDLQERSHFRVLRRGSFSFLSYNHGREYGGLAVYHVYLSFIFVTDSGP